MSRQRGVALLSVLLVMSLALLLTGGMLRNHRLVVKSTAQQLHHVQLRQLVFSGERWALQRLRDPEMRASRSVNLAQTWAQATPPFEVEGGTLNIRVEDLAARFNLSALLAGGQIDPLTQQRWVRLLALLQIRNPDLATSHFGALTDLSQLRVWPGVDGEVLRRLQPMLALLPGNASLNINTASAQQLMTLDGMSETLARALVQQRPAEGYRSVQAFVEDPLLAGLELGSHGLGLGSRW